MLWSSYPSEKTDIYILKYSNTGSASQLNQNLLQESNVPKLSLTKTKLTIHSIMEKRRGKENVSKQETVTIWY